MCVYVCVFVCWSKQKRDCKTEWCECASGRNSLIRFQNKSVGHKARTFLINSMSVCECACMLFDIWREFRVTLLCSLSFWQKKNILAHPGISVSSCEAKRDKHKAKRHAVKRDWALASADSLIWMLQSFTITTLSSQNIVEEIWIWHLYFFYTSKTTFTSYWMPTCILCKLYGSYLYHVESVCPVVQMKKQTLVYRSDPVAVCTFLHGSV